AEPEEVVPARDDGLLVHEQPPDAEGNEYQGDEERELDPAGGGGDPRVQVLEGPGHAMAAERVIADGPAGVRGEVRSHVVRIEVGDVLEEGSSERLPVLGLQVAIVMHHDAPGDRARFHAVDTPHATHSALDLASEPSLATERVDPDPDPAGE